MLKPTWLTSRKSLRRPTRKSKSRPSCRSLFGEGLEDRRLLAATVFNANEAFIANELSASETNSTFGPWSVGHFDEASPGGFTAYTSAEHTNSFRDFGQNKLQGFFINNNVDVPVMAVNVDTVNSVTTDYGSTLDPSQILMHPGGISSNGFALPIHDAILRFTVPSTGSYTIVGDWESVHPGVTNNIIRHNGVALFASTADFSNFNLTPTLTAGDTIDFVVNDYNGIGADSTGLRAVVTALDENPNEPPVIDLNGADESGIDFSTVFAGSPTPITDVDAILTDVDGGAIATAGNGDIYVATARRGIVRVDPVTGDQTLVTPAAQGAGDDTSFVEPSALVVDQSTGMIYVGDRLGWKIVKVDPNTGLKTRVPTTEPLGRISGIALDADGKLLISGTRQARSGHIYRVDPLTGDRTVIFRSETQNVLQEVRGIDVEPDGRIIAADAFKIFRIDPAAGPNQPLTPFVQASSTLVKYMDVAVTPNGDILTANDLTNLIQRIDPVTGSVSDAASVSDNPTGIAIDADGNVVASDYFRGVTFVDMTDGSFSALSYFGLLGSNGGIDITSESAIEIGDNITSLTVAITNLLDGSNEILTADTTGTNVTSDYDPGTGVLRLSGDDTAVNYQAVLRSVAYNNLTVNPNTATRVISFVANDGMDESDPAALASVVLNRPPVIENQSFDIDENLTSVGTIVASDPDTGDTLTYTISGGADSAKFQITDTNQLSFIAPPDHENPSDDGGNNVYDLTITVEDNNGAAVSADLDVTVNNITAAITGTVFVDADGDGLFDGGTETAIDGVSIELLDSALAVIDNDVTSMGGVYAFEVDDEFATYRLRETQPTGVDDGAAIVGDADGNGTTGESIDGSVISSNEMQLTLTGVDATDYDFTEIGQAVQAGDTATIGFWQNKNGQALIAQGGSNLANWLTDNFGNVFADTFAGGDGEDVARFYKDEFFKKKLKGTSKVDAQFMATALATFFTSSNLSGGNVAASYGFNVTGTGIGTKVVNVGASGDAFGENNNTDMTIMSLLLATNSFTDNDGTMNNDDDGYSHVYDANGDGVLDDAELALRALANDLYTLVNEGGDI